MEGVLLIPIEGAFCHTFWRFFFSYLLFKVAIIPNRINSETTRASHLARDCTHLYALIDKDCGSLEEHRVVTWAGGVFVSTVQKETVFVEACSMSVALAVQLRGLVCLVLCSALNWVSCWTVPEVFFCEFADFTSGNQRIEVLS